MDIKMMKIFGYFISETFLDFTLNQSLRQRLFDLLPYHQKLKFIPYALNSLSAILFLYNLHQQISSLWDRHNINLKYVFHENFICVSGSSAKERVKKNDNKGEVEYYNGP